MSVFGPPQVRESGQHDVRTISLNPDLTAPAPSPNTSTGEPGFAGLTYVQHLAIFGGFACFTITLFCIVKRLLRGADGQSLHLSNYMSHNDRAKNDSLATSSPFVKYCEEGDRIHRVYFKEPSAAKRAQERADNQIYGSQPGGGKSTVEMANFGFTWGPDGRRLPKKGGLPTLEEVWSKEYAPRQPKGISLAGLMTPRRSALHNEPRESDVFVLIHDPRELFAMLSRDAEEAGSPSAVL